jgi:hypothetical protein
VPSFIACDRRYSLGFSLPIFCYGSVWQIDVDTIKTANEKKVINKQKLSTPECQATVNIVNK